MPEDGGARRSEGSRICWESDFRMPFLGKVLEYAPGKALRVSYELALNKDLYLKDHVFVHAPGVKPLDQCSPVLPLAMAVEMMCEVAACLTPGLGIVAIEKVQAVRWVALEDVDHTEVRLEVSFLDHDEELGLSRIRASLYCGPHAGPAMSATVCLGRHYLLGLQLEFTELENPRPYPLNIEQIYGDRHLFHGPSFQTVRGPLSWGEAGFLAELQVNAKDALFQGLKTPQMLTDPGVLDGMAQCACLWAMERGMVVFPLGFEKMEFYRPPPPSGTRVPLRLQVMGMGSRTLQANVEIQDGSGSVWLRVLQARYWIYRWPRRVLDFRRLPGRYALSSRWETGTEMGPVCRDIGSRDLADFDLRMAARFYLSLQEMKEFDAFHSSPKRQREWLLGRIAAKDAVRGWVALKTGCKELHPASFSLVKNVEGAPMVASLPLKDAGRPFVSVTHSQGRGMAVAHDTPVGIDLERIEQRDGAFLELFATLEERELLKDHLSRDFHEWTTRLWSAKEAASKVVGGSITKTPHKYRLSSVNGEGAMTVRDLQEGVELVVRTYRQDDRVVALARK